MWLTWPHDHPVTFVDLVIGHPIRRELAPTFHDTKDFMHVRMGVDWVLLARLKCCLGYLSNIRNLT